MVMHGCNAAQQCNGPANSGVLCPCICPPLNGNGWKARQVACRQRRISCSSGPTSSPQHWHHAQVASLGPCMALWWDEVIHSHMHIQSVQSTRLFRGNTRMRVRRDE
jgi:hypothetical protein